MILCISDMEPGSQSHLECASSSSSGHGPGSPTSHSGFAFSSGKLLRTSLKCLFYPYPFQHFVMENLFQNFIVRHANVIDCPMDPL